MHYFRSLSPAPRQARVTSHRFPIFFVVHQPHTQCSQQTPFSPMHTTRFVVVVVAVVVVANISKRQRELWYSTAIATKDKGGSDTCIFFLLQYDTTIIIIIVTRAILSPPPLSPTPTTTSISAATTTTSNEHDLCGEAAGLEITVCALCVCVCSGGFATGHHYYYWQQYRTVVVGSVKENVLNLVGWCTSSGQWGRRGSGEWWSDRLGYDGDREGRDGWREGGCLASWLAYKLTGWRDGWMDDEGEWLLSDRG